MKDNIKKLRSFFYLLPNILSALFRSPETRDFPNKRSPFPSRYRGRVSIHAENCIGCSLCVRDCPSEALQMEKESKDKFKLVHFRDRCTYCGQCELSCRYDAIYMENDYPAPTDHKEDFFVILVDR